MTKSSFPVDPTEVPAPPAAVAEAEVRAEVDFVIRPAAVIPESEARRVIAWLNSRSLENGGKWNTGDSTGIWQRYDRPWDGPFGTRGQAQLVGTIYVTYDRPRKYEVLIHRVQVTELGLIAGWTTTSLVNEILSTVGLSIDTCRRDDTMPAGYGKDPFRQRDAYSKGGSD